MFPPEQAKSRHLVAYVTDQNKGLLDVFTTRWEYVYNQDGILISCLPMYDIIYK